jgi:hypothetical protein
MWRGRGLAAGLGGVFALAVVTALIRGGVAREYPAG